MNHVARTHRCMVCGKFVDPSVDIMLTVAGTPLMPVHQGPCRDTIKRGVVAARELVESRYPVVRFARTLFREFAKFQQQQDHYQKPR